MAGQSSNAGIADTRLANTVPAFTGPGLELNGALYSNDSIVAPDLRTFGIATAGQPAGFSLADPSSDLENIFDSLETVTPVAEAATWAMAALTVFALGFMQRRRFYQFLSKTTKESRSWSSTVTTAHSS